MNVCATCIHAHQAPLDPSTLGQERPIICHRYPPVAYPIPAGPRGMMTICVRPTVSPGEGCGEWEGKAVLS